MRRTYHLINVTEAGGRVVSSHDTLEDARHYVRLTTGRYVVSHMGLVVWDSEDAAGKDGTK